MVCVLGCFKLPVHLFGEKNWYMSYDSSYKNQQNVEMGKKALEKVVEVLIAFNEANCKRKSFKRERMLQTLNVFAGETQRLSAVLRFFIINLDSECWEPLGGLSFWTNHWANLGDGIMRVVLALLAKIMLEEEAGKIEAEKHMSMARDSLKEFKDILLTRNISLTREDFMAKIPADLVGVRPKFLRHKRMHNEFIAGNIASSPVFGADEPAHELSLPLLISYIMLIKYEHKLVPELILRKVEYAAFLKAKKEKKKKKKKGATNKEKEEAAEEE